MSTQHTLDIKEERNRISHSKGKITKDNRVFPSIKEIPREMIHLQKLGLRMSRSLGHLTLSKYGGKI